MNIIDITHLILHFAVIGSFLYLFQYIVKHRNDIKSRYFFNVLPKFQALSIICLTMMYNLLHQATHGTFLFGNFTIFKLTKLPWWILTNGLIFIAILYYIKKDVKND